MTNTSVEFTEFLMGVSNDKGCNRRIADPYPLNEVDTRQLNSLIDSDAELSTLQYIRIMMEWPTKPSEGYTIAAPNWGDHIAGRGFNLSICQPIQDIYQLTVSVYVIIAPSTEHNSPEWHDPHTIPLKQLPALCRLAVQHVAPILANYSPYSDAAQIRLIGHPSTFDTSKMGIRVFYTYQDGEFDFKPDVHIRFKEFQSTLYLAPVSVDADIVSEILNS